VRGRITLGAIAAVAIVLGGCGGGSDSSSSTSTTTTNSTPSSAGNPTATHAVERTPFGKRVTAVCFKGTEALGTLPQFPFPTFDPLHPEVSKLPAIASFFQSGSLPAYQKLIAELKKIQPPASQKKKYDEFVQQLDRLVANLERQVAAAKSSDAKAFVVTVKAAGGQGLPDAESALGIRSCYGIS
jgi:hypothetical protein